MTEVQVMTPLNIVSQVYLDGFGNLGTNGPLSNAVVVDLEGNNTVSIAMDSDAYDVTPQLSTTVVLGDGNDTVAVNNRTEANNTNGHSAYDIDLGNRTNSLTVNDRTGNIDLNIVAGNGSDDNVALTYTLDEREFLGNERSGAHRPRRGR
ncbi:MAG: hypothetical protein H6897_14405 [Rhodobacteraceae bacterium]|nr:hypothetical protein [Paracoccaceae bacterium]